MKFNIKSKNGFTLIELLVVIGILAVLAAIAIPSVAGLIDRANVSADNTNANEMTNAIERFVSEYELYRQDIQSNLIDSDNLDSTQSRVYNSVGASTISDIKLLESDEGLNGKGLNINTKYPVNEYTVKSILEHYTKTSSSTFEPKQSDMSYYYAPVLGTVICAQTGSTTDILLNTVNLNSDNKINNISVDDIQWINLSLNANTPSQEWTDVNVATDTENKYTKLNINVESAKNNENSLYYSSYEKAMKDVVAGEFSNNDAIKETAVVEVNIDDSIPKIKFLSNATINELIQITQSCEIDINGKDITLVKSFLFMNCPFGKIYDSKKTGNLNNSYSYYTIGGDTSTILVEGLNINQASSTATRNCAILAYDTDLTVKNCNIYSESVTQGSWGIYSASTGKSNISNVNVTVKSTGTRDTDISNYLYDCVGGILVTNVSNSVQSVKVNIDVSNSLFSGDYIYGIYTKNTTTLKDIDINVNGNMNQGGIGVAIQNDGTQANLNNVKTKVSGTGNYFYGINISNNAVAIAKNCTFIANGGKGSGSRAVSLQSTGTVKIDNSILESTTSNGGGIVSNSQTNKSYISNSHIKASYGFIASGSDEVYIGSGNTVEYAISETLSSGHFYHTNETY